jgi:hypothetical protein
VNHTLPLLTSFALETKKSENKSRASLIFPVSRVTVICTIFRCYNGDFSKASTRVDGPSVAVGDILWWSRNVVGWTTIPNDYECDQLVSVLKG